MPHNNGWRKKNKYPSLSESFSSISIPKNSGFWKKFFIFSGPGLLIAVGYMDPGNWATDIIGGAKYGYLLLSIILISNIFAIFLQYLSIKLGVVTERDLAQACRDHYPNKLNIFLWIICELAIAACDMAEIIGSSLALKLLFNLPIKYGIIITTLNVLVIIFFHKKKFRYIEGIVALLIFTISICFILEFFKTNPSIVNIFYGLIPNYNILLNKNALYIAVGILGATVMPHNLYLHSSLVQTRDYSRDIEGKKMAIKYATIDIIWSLFLAFFINAAILIIAASIFYMSGHTEVSNIIDAYKLLTPLTGSSLVSILFGIALFASGQNSTLTGMFAGQIVMEGFTNIKIKPWIRRIITRLIALIPAIIITIIYKENASELLVFSQVILSMQLSFAIIPLIKFTSDKKKMGEFVNSLFIKITSWIISCIIIMLNIFLIYSIL